MAYLEETQLLRALILRPTLWVLLGVVKPFKPLKLPFVLTLGLTAFAWAMTAPDVGYPQEQEDGSVLFAPGATGGIAPSLDRKVQEAEENADILRDHLNIQSQNDFGTQTDFEALRKRALNNPRVRALLGADTQAPNTANRDEGPRWGEAKVWVLASFSMPDEALRALMVEAKRYGVPVVMRGFVQNSVYATRDRLLEVFGSDEDIEGFSIDPTLFSRFDVVAVPTFIALAGEMEACETQGCEGDRAPPHDKLAGNVTLEHALQWIARAPGAEAKEAAVFHLKIGDRP
ncbi:MAG: type-F conjugative transfer system pilin assembly protein TrbC [Pseudomonadota bacterium]